MQLLNVHQSRGTFGKWTVNQCYASAKLTAQIRSHFVSLFGNSFTLAWVQPRPNWE